MNDHGYAVILAGGKGERFWPASTSKHPKQFLSLVGDRPLVRQSVDRLQGLVDMDRVLIITSADLVGLTREVVPELPPDNIIGEPMGRDTAAAVALAGSLVRSRDPKGAFCILTADHIIGDLPLFQKTLREGLDLAMSRDVLVTIGILPAEPSSAYGYIETGDALHEADGISFLEAKRFVEKPDTETARSYVSQGNYYWNSGMFTWSVDSLEKAFARHCPEMSRLMNDLDTMAGAGNLTESLRPIYEKLNKISIDFALMEKADNIVTARGTFAWDDVGSWTALANHIEPDAGGNVVIGPFEHLDASNNIVVSPDHLTTLIGVEDLVVVHTGQATLVCSKDKAQHIKQLLQKLRDRQDLGEVL